MGFFPKKKDKNDNAEPKRKKRKGEPDVVVEDSGGSEEVPLSKKDQKVRINKIRKLQKKFNETVWNTAYDTMKNKASQFMMKERDPDDPDTEIYKFMLLGFDLGIVDYFSNKNDEDAGSFASAITSGLDCVIENGLIENDMILMIPTVEALAVLEDFDEVFEPKYKIVYANSNHMFTVENMEGDEDAPVLVTLAEVRDMLANNVSVVEFIRSKRGGRSEIADTDGDSISSPVTDDDYDQYGDDVNDDDVADYDLTGEDGNYDSYGSDGDDEPSVQDVSLDSIADSAANAVNTARRIGDQINGQFNSLPPTQLQQQDPQQIQQQVSQQVQQPAPQQVQQVQQTQPMQQGATPAQTAAPTATQTIPSAADMIGQIAALAQKASDKAKQDPDIVTATQQHVGVLPSASNEQPGFDVQALDDYVTRRYYSDDLGIEVSSKPFDAMFSQSNDYIPFAESTGGKWIDDYANQLRRDANTRLARLHQENLLFMRERYLKIVDEQCKEIVKAVSVDDPRSRFGYIEATTKQNRDSKLANFKTTVEPYKKECQDNFEARLRAERENAANAAEANFINKYGREHERQLKEIEDDLRNNIEQEYRKDMQDLLNNRRTEAKRQLDQVISQTLSVCADEYTKMMSVERQEYVRLQKVITTWINENMAADDAMSRVEEERQRRENESVMVREEYEAKLGLMTEDFNARLAAAKAEIDQRNIEHDNHVIEVRDQYEAMMQNMRSSHAETVAHKDSEIEILNGQLNSANVQIDELIRKYANLDSEASNKYKSQIEMLASERDAWTDRARHVENLHKYTDKLKLTGVIIAVAAALGAGIILGCVIMSKTTGKNFFSQIGISEQDPVVHYYVDGNEVDGVNTGENSSGVSVPVE